MMLILINVPKSQIVPSIKWIWPECLSKTIYIQQDNARPHIGNEDLDFQAVANGDGFKISLVQQPPNSPDCNVNDLGFFRAIQSLQQQHQCRDATDLVNAVISSFNTLEAITLNKVFLSLQCCLKEIMTVKGCNNYKIPHMKKNSLLLLNELPKDLEVPKELVKESLEYLLQHGHTNGLEKLISDIGLVIT